MSLIRWNPWSIDRFLDEDWDLPTIPGISRLVGQGLNLYETDDNIIAEAALPGIPEDKIDVSVEDGVVRITASTQDKKEDKNKRKYYMSSLAESFNYSFRLPQNVISDQEPICEFDNGVLTMTFPKVQKQAPKKIKINTKNKESKK